MKHKTLTLIAIVLSAVMVACAQSGKKEAVIAFYNLENLFDTVDDPLTNDAEFLPEGSNQWTLERYQKKLENMSSVICLIGKENGGVVVIGVVRRHKSRGHVERGRLAGTIRPQQTDDLALLQLNGHIIHYGPLAVFLH